MAKIYLVPNVLSDSEWQNVLPARVFEILTNTKYFIVENVRTARRFLKKVNKEIDIDDLTFFELNKFTQEADLPKFLEPAKNHDIAIISEAGCPGVADPGAEIVKLAHKKNLTVVPVTGPSSIVLSLMASGLNGQNFAFNGYLSVKPHERQRELRNLEEKAKKHRQTQIFIETPYRNNQLINDILKTCSASTLLCISANLTAENEFIQTKTIAVWKKNVPDLHKKPAIFLIGS